MAKRVFFSFHYEDGLLRIYIDNIKDQDGKISYLRGSNPFENVDVQGGFWGASSIASRLSVPLYDWVKDGGRAKIAAWIDSAPKKTGP
jgi:hypothetical protein